MASTLLDKCVFGKLALCLTLYFSGHMFSCVTIFSPQEAVSELKERVRAQYQRMHALLEANQAEAVQMLESVYIKYVRKNSQQALLLNEKRQEAEKLLSSVHMFLQRTESINSMKVQMSSFCHFSFLLHKQCFYSVYICRIKALPLHSEKSIKLEKLFFFLTVEC